MISVVNSDGNTESRDQNNNQDHEILLIETFEDLNLKTDEEINFQ